MISDLIKIKMLAVDQGRPWRTVSEDLIIDIAAGVDTHGRGRISRTARTVSRSAAPGPAPMKWMVTRRP